MQKKKTTKSPIINSKDKINRLAKRLERRQQQRVTNILRAKKMHDARVDLKQNSATDNNLVLPNVLIGCSGWFYWHWRDKFYPAALSPNEWFKFYRKKFKTVELNAPFYSWPTLNTVNNWVKQINNSKFIYTVKVCELITHIKKFIRTGNLIKDFYYISTILKKSMGCFLFQFPPSYKYTPARLKNILNQLDPQYRNVVEFRHKSWWNYEVYNQFKRHKIIFCSCSSPNLPDNLISTTDEVYIRFHGKSKWYRHNYSKSELKDWVDKIAAVQPKRIWVYFNNDNESYAIQNAKEFTKQIKKSLISN